MRHLTALVCLSLVLAAACPALAQAPRPSVSFGDRTLVFGESTTMSGTLPGGGADAGTTVDVISRVLPDTSYRRILRGTADAAGAVSFPITPTSNSYYGIATKSVTSLAYLIHVQPSIAVRVSDAHPQRDGRVRFSGVVKPALTGTLVSVQRLKGTRTWQTVGTTRLTDDGDPGASTYAMRVRVTSTGSYRVTVNATDELDTGASAPRHLAVR